MTRQEIIDELFEFRTMLDRCGFDPDCCEDCPVTDSCDKFGTNAGGHAVNVLDAAIEMLKEKNE